MVVFLHAEVSFLGARTLTRNHIAGSDLVGS